MKYLIVLLISAFLVIGGYFGYQYYLNSKSATSKPATSKPEQAKTIPSFIDYRNRIKFNIPEGFKVEEKVSSDYFGLRVELVGDVIIVIEDTSDKPSTSISPDSFYVENEGKFYTFRFLDNTYAPLKNEEDIKKAVKVRDELVKSLIFFKPIVYSPESCLKQNNCTSLEILKPNAFKNVIELKDAKNNSLYTLNLPKSSIFKLSRLLKFNDKLLVLKQDMSLRTGFLLFNFKDGYFEDLPLEFADKYYIFDMAVSGNKIYFVASDTCSLECGDANKNLYVLDYETKTTKLIKKDLLNDTRHLVFLNSDSDKVTFLVDSSLAYSKRIVQFDLKNNQIATIYQDNPNNENGFADALKFLNIKFYNKFSYEPEKGLIYNDEVDYSKWGAGQNFVVKLMNLFY